MISIHLHEKCQTVVARSKANLLTVSYRYTSRDLFGIYFTWYCPSTLREGQQVESTERIYAMCNVQGTSYRTGSHSQMSRKATSYRTVIERQRYLQYYIRCIYINSTYSVHYKIFEVRKRRLGDCTLLKSLNNEVLYHPTTVYRVTGT